MPRSASRCRFLKSGSAAATALALWHAGGSRAAGSLSVGFWDHRVPGANEVLARICHAWAVSEKVDLKIDFITANGNKLATTFLVESQTKSGHDLLALGGWTTLAAAAQLEPLDDVMEPLVQRYGPVFAAAEAFSRVDGHWISAPAVTGAISYPACARLDLFRQHAGLDLQAMFPAGAPPTAQADDWTWDTLLGAAAKLHKAGHPVGLPLGQTFDSIEWVSSLFASHGAELVNANGDVTVRSDAVRQVLEYARRLAEFMPADVYAWDDSSNNKYLVSGQGSLIFNAPSPWTAAKRDAPKVAEQLWTFHVPRGPKGRCLPFLQAAWSVWTFAKNKAAAKSLIAHVLQRENVEAVVNASDGYDIPPFRSMQDFRVWQDAAPPKGTLYHYPPRQDQRPWVSGTPAPAPIARRMYAEAILPKMVARCTQGGESIERTLAWAASELEGYARR